MFWVRQTRVPCSATPPHPCTQTKLSWFSESVKTKKILTGKQKGAFVLQRPWMTVGCLFVSVFMCAMEVSLQMGPFLGEKCRHWIPLGGLELWLLHRMGLGKGHRRMKKREEGVGQGQFQWGPRPRGESPTVYPTSQQQQKARGVFGTQLPKFLETALLKGICWAHFWGKFPFWGSWSKGISCVGRQSFLTWRLLGRETVS